MNNNIRLRRISIPIITLLILALFSFGAFAQGPPDHAGQQGPPAHATNSKYDTETSLTPEKALELSSDRWISEQEAVETAILADFEAGNYTLSNPLIVVNPYGTAPLSALVLFETEEKVSVELLVKGKEASENITNSFNQKETDHIIPVYGLYEGETTVVIKTSAGQSSEIVIETEELPQVVDQSGNKTTLTSEVKVVGDERMYPGITFASVNGWVPDGVVLGFDAKGDIRCVLENANWCQVYLGNGRILATSPKHERGMYFFAGIVELDLMGKVHKEYLRNGVHHGYRKLLNGNYIVIADMVGRNTVEDHIVELDGKTGEVVRSWDLREAWGMKEYKSSPSYNYNEKDWLHINSIWLCPGEDAILVSGRHQDVFFKLDLSKNEVVWAMTEDYEQYTDKFKEKLLKPVGDDFEYVWGQHNIKMMDDGRILVFDNGNGRSKDPNKVLPGDSDKNYSRVVVYDVDEENMTVEQVWQYGKERGTEFGAFTQGFMKRLCDSFKRGKKRPVVLKRKAWDDWSFLISPFQIR